MSISVTIQHRKAGMVRLNAVSVGSRSRILVAAPLTGLDMLSNQTCASSFVPQGEIWSQLDIAPSRYLSSGNIRPPLHANNSNFHNEKPEEDPRRCGSFALLSPSALVNYSNDLSPHLSAQKKDGVIILPRACPCTSPPRY